MHAPYGQFARFRTDDRNSEPEVELNALTLDGHATAFQLPPSRRLYLDNSALQCHGDSLGPIVRMQFEQNILHVYIDRAG
jgi:hypothetical protein